MSLLRPSPDPFQWTSAERSRRRRLRTFLFALLGAGIGYYLGVASLPPERPDSKVETATASAPAKDTPVKTKMAAAPEPAPVVPAPAEAHADAVAAAPEPTIPAAAPVTVARPEQQSTEATMPAGTVQSAAADPPANPASLPDTSAPEAATPAPVSPTPERAQPPRAPTEPAYAKGPRESPSGTRLELTAAQKRFLLQRLKLGSVAHTTATASGTGDVSAARQGVTVLNPGSAERSSNTQAEPQPAVPKIKAPETRKQEQRADKKRRVRTRPAEEERTVSVPAMPPRRQQEQLAERREAPPLPEYHDSIEGTAHVNSDYLALRNWLLNQP